jgi:HAD superfamily hydrolase (TIGR01509 family)
MSIKGIIFDVDGVIFDSEKLHREAWKEVFEKRNIFLTDDRSGVGRSDKEFLKELKEKGTIPENINIKEIQEEKLAFLIELADKRVDFFPNVEELLISLKKNYLLCVASNSDRKFIVKILKNTNLLPYFESILTVNDVENPKPAPDIYLLAAERMGFKPKECIVIEDSAVGIEAAKNAGMKCVAISHTLPKDRLKKADLLLEQISVEKIERFIEKQDS